MEKLQAYYQQYVIEPNPLRTIVTVLLAILIAFWLSEIVARIIIRIVKRIASHADQTTSEERQLQLRRIETYMGVIVAGVRFFIVVGIAYAAYKTVSVPASNTTAAIGASAIFVVLANGTAGYLLRDITAGSAMIIERWFNVGDHIRVEPFGDVAGVVERMTLRATKIRSLNGDIVWLNNQYIQGVKVTPRGLRTIAVDIFVKDVEAGSSLVQKAIDAIPTGPLMLALPLTIKTDESWATGLHHFEVVGQTAPGREWLIEQFFVDSLKLLDDDEDNPTMVRPPLVRNADPDADRNFKRAVRVAKREQARH